MYETAPPCRIRWLAHRSIKSSNPAELEEDRRKFYVALTRARRRVHLVWAQWRISRRGNPYPIALSRFALDLIEDQLPGS